MKKHLPILGLGTILVLVTLACTLGAAETPPPDSSMLNTQVALVMTQTALGNPPPPAETSAGSNQDPGLLNTQVALALTQTAMSAGPGQPPASTQQPPASTTQQPPDSATQQPPASATQDIEALIDASNILIYEDIVDYHEYIPYVKRALDSVGGYHKHVADAMGTFMTEMNSGTHWDLIIVASEARDLISGDYWTVLKQKVDDGAALISEIWYVDEINGGKIAPFLNECGVKLQSDWQSYSTYNQIDYPVYWVDSNHPVFNTPNRVNPFGASLTDPAWMFGDLGDLMEVTDPARAQILAARSLSQDGSNGLLTACMDGRVLLQTFSSHNYPTNGMVALWENYIVYTLTNHFQEAH